MFFGKFGEAEQKTDEEKQQESRDNLRNALVDIAQRKLEKERHLRSIDPTGRIFPLKQYLYLCRIADYIVQTQSFANFIFSCIAIAGLLVGIETYPALQDVYVLNIIETMVLVAFCAEVVLKVMAEGTDPSMYLRGKEWKWNIFDLTIVIMSMPFVTVVGNISFLRLIRLMRLAKVFNKIPQLRMIINGLLGGLKSIAYICILLFLVFYLFAISGILAFRKNDPWHFRSVITTLVGLFQFSTLSDWSEVFYINYYGCDKFEGSFYTNNVTLASTKSGGLTYCEAPEAQPFLSFLYFIAFIFICSFTMLSLFVGAIIESMTESMKTMKEEQEKEKRKKIMEEAQRKFKNVMANKNKQNKRVRRALNLLQLAFEGGNLKVVSENFEGEPFFKSSFKKLSHICDKIADDSRFQNFVTFVIIVAGVQVGIATDPQIAREYRTVLSVVNQMIQFVFTIECAIKILAEEFAPWIYFDNGWNLFDFLVVAASYYSGGGSFIVMLRLVRLLRVLKLMRSLPQLQVIVSSLLSGLTSIGFISVLVLLFLYFYAIIGLIFFGKNDPYSFGTLHYAMIVLFQACTLDNWQNYMYTNMYGCDQFGYEDMPELCVNPQANMPISVAYFVFLILVGAWVLFALFIGVVATGMEQAALEQIEQREVDEGVKRVQQEQDISDEMVELYREVFQTIDLEKGGDIEQDELRLGLDLAGRTDITEEKFARLWKRVDTDGSGGIDFGEFFRFMLSIRKSALSNFNQDDDVLDEDLIIRAPVKIKPKASPLNVIDKRVFLEELEKSSSQILKTQSSGRPTSAPLSINRSFTTDTPEQAGAKKAKVRKELDDLEKELIIIDDDLLSKNRPNAKSNLSQTTEVQKEIPTITKPVREEKTENHPNQDSPVAENVKPPIARASSLKKDMKEGDKSSAFVSPKQTVTKSPSSRPKAEEVNIEMPTLTKGANLHEKNETLTQDHQYQSVTPPPGDVKLRSKPTTPVPKSPQIVIAENADILNSRPLETAPHTPQSIYTYGNENEDTNKFIQSKQFYKRGNSLCTTETTTPKPLKKRNMSSDSITYHDGELAFIPSSGSIEEKDGLTRPQYYRVYSRQYSTPAESFHESLHEDSPSIDYFDSIDRSPNLSRTRNRPKRPVVSRACYI